MDVRAGRWIAEGAMLAAVLGFAGLANGCAQDGAPARAGSTAAAQPVLLELFTSEGCSSCPPADALLKELDRRQTPAGQLLIGLSEHVTYWNNLGWTDPFSADQFTRRQSAYSDRFHLDSVYTPQLVINGSEQVVGSDRRGLARALSAERQRTGELALTIDSVRRVPGGLDVRYTLAGGVEGRPAELFAAIADDMDHSNVLRGENGGRTLNHVAVVRSLARVGPAADSAGSREISVPLPPAAAGGARQHLVLFAQEANFGPVLGVAEQPLGVAEQPLARP